MDRGLIINDIKSIVKMHKDGVLGGEVMPEDVLLGVVPENQLLNVLTLGMSLNYQRNSYQLWEGIAKAWSDEDVRWVFNLSIAGESRLDDLRNALQKHRIALQPNRHPEIWQRVSKGIVNSSETRDVLGLLKSVQFDIKSLKDIMQKTRKSEFPYLSGPKIFNYWLYAIESYTNVKWQSRHLITIAPDTHVLQATVKLGLCSSEVLEGTANHRQLVADTWEQVLEGSDIEPTDIHTPLWLWSRAGFPDSH
ncbi:hypothetical protein BAMA_14800 [Bacillus manliponensis]|uniref:Uncharacterized protein n=1 Tax=Bacillus manliponensis TaxID=574376 RepID=A0A073K028_9BACI|nr:hypothetical protein [Bacillus manliponensis]KEK20674.1 hypothetical protein BAMA_14800 [Bacillus manliponensis]